MMISSQTETHLVSSHDFRNVADAERLLALIRLRLQLHTESFT